MAQQSSAALTGTFHVGWIWLSLEFGKTVSGGCLYQGHQSYIGRKRKLYVLLAVWKGFIPRERPHQPIGRLHGAHCTCGNEVQEQNQEEDGRPFVLCSLVKDFEDRYISWGIDYRVKVENTKAHCESCEEHGYKSDTDRAH